MNSTKRLRALAAGATAVLVSGLGLATTAAGTALAEGQNGTTLTETVTANPSYTKTFGWSITKSADPTTLNLFKGDTGSANYTVSVTKDQGTVAASVSGQVCITNGGAVDTQGLQSTLELSMPSDQTVIQSQPLDVSSEPVIPGGVSSPPYPANQTACYDYTMVITNPVPGGSYKITADTTILNHSGHLGGPFGPAGSASFSLPSSPALVNDSVDVQDSLAGDLGPFSGDHTFQYPLGYPDVLKAGDNPNTATIYGDGGQPLGSASADVQVNVFELGVAKTANTTYTRDWSWGIQKSVSPTSLTLAVGQSFPVQYTVQVTPTSTDSAWAVHGDITITNPAPMDAQVNVADALQGLPGVNVSFTDSQGNPLPTPQTVPAGGQLAVKYQTDALPAGNAGTNKATVTQTLPNNGQTVDYYDQAGYSFGNPTTVHGQTATVNDSLAGQLGQVDALGRR
jgi:hypothetical protein